MEKGKYDISIIPVSYKEKKTSPRRKPTLYGCLDDLFKYRKLMSFHHLFQSETVVIDC